MHFLLEASTKYIDDILATLSNLTQGFDNMKRLETEKKTILQEMRITKENPMKLLSLSTLRVFFDNHPLAQEVIGSPEIIQNATVENLKKHLGFFLTPERSAVVVVSNLSHDKILESVVKYFEPWKPGLFPKTTEKKQQISNAHTHKDYLYIANSNKQTSIMINFHTPGALNINEEAALTLVANYLGSGGKAFLREKLRSETGLVYTVTVSTSRYTDTGVFQVYTSSSEPTQTIKIIFDSLSALLSSISPADVEETKERAVNIFDRSVSNPRYENDFLGQSFILFNHLFEPADYKRLIKEVSYEGVTGVAKKYLRRNNCLIAISGPKDIKDEI